MTAHYMQLIGEQEPEQRNPEFSDSDVAYFMRDFVMSKHETASEWLKQNGCDELPDYAADLLQSMAITFRAGHLDIPGSDRFWQAMKQLAIQKFDFDNSI